MSLSPTQPLPLPLPPTDDISYSASSPPQSQSQSQSSSQSPSPALPPLPNRFSPQHYQSHPPLPIPPAIDSPTKKRKRAASAPDGPDPSASASKRVQLPSISTCLDAAECREKLEDSLGSSVGQSPAPLVPVSNGHQHSSPASHQIHTLPMPNGHPSGAPAIHTSLMQTYLSNPINPLPSHYALLSTPGPPPKPTRPRPAAPRVALLAPAAPRVLSWWPDACPAGLEGPLVLLAANLGGPDRPATQLIGPIDPALLDRRTAPTVYYACRPATQPGAGGYMLPLEAINPVLGGTPLRRPAACPTPVHRPTAPPVQLMTPAVFRPPHRSASQDFVAAPEPVDPSRPADPDSAARRRAPRKCGVCGQYDCKGRGNRTLCPQFVGGRDGYPADRARGSPATVWRWAPQEAKPNGSHPAAAALALDQSRPSASPPTQSSSRTWARARPSAPGALGSSQAPPVADSQQHALSGADGAEEGVRRRGPRRCAVCGQLNCPGNGNRKMCVQVRCQPKEEESEGDK